MQWILWEKGSIRPTHIYSKLDKVVDQLQSQRKPVCFSHFDCFTFSAAIWGGSSSPVIIHLSSFYHGCKTYSVYDCKAQENSRIWQVDHLLYLRPNESRFPGPSEPEMLWPRKAGEEHSPCCSGIIKQSCCFLIRQQIWKWHQRWDSGLAWNYSRFFFYELDSCGVTEIFMEIKIN